MIGKFEKKLLFFDGLLTILSLSFLFLILPRFLFFISASLLIIHRALGLSYAIYLSKPIRQIFSSLSSFQEGKEELLSPIVLKAFKKGKEGYQLASVLNALISRIQRQVDYLTRQQEEKEGILESLQEGIIALNPSAEIIFANKAAKQMLQISENGCLQKRLNAVNAKSKDLAQKCHDLILHSLQIGEPIQSTTQGPPYFKMSASLLRDGVLLVIQDQTSDVKMIEMGKDFIANASHELRTPITIIRGFAETLSDIPSLSKKTQEEIVGKIVRTCERLDHLIKSLLTLADVENRSEKRLQKTNLIPLLENSIHLASTIHPEAEISFHTELKEALVLADSDLIELAISNLLENGIKYSSTKVQIEVTLESIKSELFIRFKDYGMGIPKEDLGRIFERFYTVNKARSRKNGGAGIGLSIVKTIMEKHKGSIFVESKAKEGSIFTLQIPSEKL